MRWLFRLAMQRAIAKGSGRFAAIGVAIGFLRVLRKLAGAEPRTMYKHELQPGEVLVVTDGKQPR